MKNLALLLLISIMAFSCSDDDVDTSSMDGIFIRAENGSAYDFENLLLLDSEIGALNAGERSEYIEFEMAYRYGFIKLDIENESLDLIPIDFVGETPLEDGMYTYKLDILEDNGNLTNILLEFKED